MRILSKRTILSSFVARRRCYFSSFEKNDDPYILDPNASRIEQNVPDYHVKRIWMGNNASLPERIGRFINRPLGTLHPLDIKLSSIELIRECGKLNSFEGMKHAQDLLDRMIEEKKHVHLEDGSSIIVPDRPFQMVMYGWANLCKKVSFAPQRMREVLALMIHESEYDNAIIKQNRKVSVVKKIGSHSYNDVFDGLSCEPTVGIYNTLLQGLSQAASRSIQSAIESEHVLSKMEKMNRTRGWHTKPNTRSFSLVLNAYAKTRHITAGDRAELVLRKMIQCNENDRKAYYEDYEVEYNVHDLESNKRQIVTPDVIAYSTVIHAFGRSDSDKASEKALDLLNELIRSNDPSLQPDAFAFANTIHAFARKASMKKSSQARFDAAKRAEDVLWMFVDEIKKRSETTKAIEDCAVLKNQKSSRLTGSIVPFNSCLNAWAKSCVPESPHRADSLLHRMLDSELQAVAKIHPNTASFNNCMLAWSKSSSFEEQSSAPEKAEEILDLLKEKSKENDQIRIELRSYVIVMNAYAVSRRNDSVHHTRRLLLELLQEYRDEINASPFTALFKAVANTNRIDCGSKEIEPSPFGSLDESSEIASVEDDDPYSIALKTYRDLVMDVHNLGVRVDHFAFSEMLAVIQSHTDDESVERRHRIEEIFQHACRSGQVSSLVVRALQNVCPNNLMFRELLQLDETMATIESINILPKPWTSHVSREFYRVNSRGDYFQQNQIDSDRKNKTNNFRHKHSSPFNR